MADPSERHFFGQNRPEQTGEAASHGFRTSAHADAAPTLPSLDPTGESCDHVITLSAPEVISEQKGNMTITPSAALVAGRTMPIPYAVCTICTELAACLNSGCCLSP